MAGCLGVFISTQASRPGAMGMCGLVAVGSYGWVNLQQVKSVERRESGAMVVHFIGGQEIALLPDEARELEAALGEQGYHRIGEREWR